MTAVVVATFTCFQCGRMVGRQETRFECSISELRTREVRVSPVWEQLRCKICGGQPMASDISIHELEKPIDMTEYPYRGVGRPRGIPNRAADKPGFCQKCMKKLPAGRRAVQIFCNARCRSNFNKIVSYYKKRAEAQEFPVNGPA